MNGYQAYFAQLHALLSAGESVLTATAIQPETDSGPDGPVQLHRALLGGGGIFCTDPSYMDFWERVFADLDPQKPLPHMQAGRGHFLLFERLCARGRLVICGGGHIAVPLCRIASMLELDVTVIDDRPEFVTPERFPDAAELVCQPFDRAMREVDYGEGCYFVIITRGHKDDRLCLEQVLRHRFGYVGMIGSRKKVAVVMEQLAREGVPPSLLSQVHAPIGLRIGAQTPAEIAVCIAAQLIQHRAGASDGSLPPEALARLAAGERMALATILSKTGSAPRGTGAKLLMDQDGRLYGSVGGGAGEAAVLETARQVLQTGRAQIVTCSMTNQDAQQDGMVCGGALQVLVERTG